MKPQYHRDDFIFKEDILVKMLRILRLIAQDIKKPQNKKPHLINHSYEQPKFDDCLDVVDQVEVSVDASFNLVELKEVLVDTSSYSSFDFAKRRKKDCCDIFQILVGYEKKPIFLNYVKIRHKEYEKVIIKTLFIEEFILLY